MTKDEFDKIFTEFNSEQDTLLCWTPKVDCIYAFWINDGSQGGNCWGDDSEYYSGYSSPETDVLSLFLQKYFPNISFLQFRELQEICVEEFYRENEYYGNYTNYGIWYYPKDKLLEKLEKFGCVSS